MADDLDAFEEIIEAPDEKAEEQPKEEKPKEEKPKEEKVEKSEATPSPTAKEEGEPKKNVLKSTEDISAKEKSPENLNYEELLEVVKTLQREMRHLNTENDLVEEYLQINEPQMLEGMNKLIENAMKMQSSEVVRKFPAGDTFSIKSMASLRQEGSSFMNKDIRSLASLRRDTSSIQGTSSMMQRGPRINLTQKSDMVMKKTEEMEKEFNKFTEKTHKERCILKAELEELELEINEATDCLHRFETDVAIGGIDSLTQRIPAEIFVRFMQEWLKVSSALVQKYRLKQSTLFVQLRKLIQVLKEKKELGESLHAVDFEKLEIENGFFAKEIDMRTVQLVDLKKMNGGANLFLTNQKKILAKQTVTMREIKENIEETKNKITELETQIAETERQLEKEKILYNSIKQITEEYRVPGVMEYIKIKSKLTDMQKNIKIWSRRVNLQNVTLNSTIREMKHITGSKKVLDSWFTREYASTYDMDLRLEEEEMEMESHMSGSNESDEFKDEDD